MIYQNAKLGSLIEPPTGKALILTATQDLNANQQICTLQLGRIMPERSLKVDVKFSWHLIWIFALLEGVTVPLAPLFTENGPHVKSTVGATTEASQVTFLRNMMIIGMYGISIGFVGTLIVCLLLNHIAFRKLKLHLNSAIVFRIVHPTIIGLWGGLLLATYFWIQHCIGSLLVFSLIVNLMIFGFVSAAGGTIATGLIYLLTVKALPYLGVHLVTTEHRLLLTKIPIVSFAALIALYEGLAMPILHIWTLVPQHKVLIALLAGPSGGALSSLIVVALTHLRVINKHMWLKFLIIVK
jgi:hypothetical protein